MVSRYRRETRNQVESDAVCRRVRGIIKEQMEHEKASRVDPKGKDEKSEGEMVDKVEVKRLSRGSVPMERLVRKVRKEKLKDSSKDVVERNDGGERKINDWGYTGWKSYGENVIHRANRQAKQILILTENMGCQ